MTSIKTIDEEKNSQKLKMDTTSGFDQIILAELFRRGVKTPQFQKQPSSSF